MEFDRKRFINLSRRNQFDLLIHMQVDVVTSPEGKQQIKLAILPAELKERRYTYMSFTAHKYGEPINNLIPAVDNHQLLTLKLYWTDEVYEQPELVDKVSERLYRYIKKLMRESAGWNAIIATRFQSDDWHFTDYWDTGNRGIAYIEDK